MRDQAISYPANPAQQRLWFIDRVAEARSRPAYLVPTVIELGGPVDCQALRMAVALVLQRHPALRSRFELDAAGRQVRYRSDGPAPAVALTDAGAAGWAPREVEQRVSELCWAHFDLGAEAPARAAVIATGERTLLVLCAHHIVLDGWSRQLLMDEVGEAYRAAVEGRAPELPEPVHPAEADAPEAAEGLDERIEEVVASLLGAPVDVRLPHDRPRPEVQPARGASHAAPLGAELTGRLRAIAGEQGCTTFMVMACLLAATLARLSAQRDFLFAFPWLGRETPASRGAVGMLVNTLLLRVDLSGRPTWRELLDRVRAASLTSYANADVPFDAVVAVLHRDRDLSRPPLTPVMVNVVDGPLRPPDLGPGVHGRQLPLHPYHVRYELSLEVTDCTDDLHLALDYAVELFHEATIAGLLDTLRRNALDLVSSPDAPVLDVVAAEAGPPRRAASGPEAAPAPLNPAAADLVEEVRRAWREVLDIGAVPLDVNFLDAGGDSLLLVVLLDRLSTLTGRGLRAADLFRCATVASQARLLAERRDERPRPAPVPETPAPGTGRDRLLGRARLARAADRSEQAPEPSPSSEVGGRRP
jgi:hypothetical protein